MVDKENKYLNFARSITKYNQDFPYTTEDMLVKMRQTGVISNNIFGDMKGRYILYIKRGINFNVPNRGLAKIIFERRDGEFYPKMKKVNQQTSQK